MLQDAFDRVVVRQPRRMASPHCQRLLSLPLAALVAFFYGLSLRILGHLLQRREKEILQVVSHEVE